MGSTSLFLKLTFAFFAFVFAAAPVMGISQRELTLEYTINSYGFDAVEDCDVDSPPFDVRFYYYLKNNTSGELLDFNAPPTEGILESTETKILTHGYKGSVEQFEFREVLKAYISSTELINVIALDWSNYTTGMYRDAAKSAVAIGKTIPSLFCLLYKFYDIYPHQIHFIGHNLGAHLWGVASSESKTKIGRISALDPARLCFETDCNGVFLRKLSGNDAHFVDVIHTEIGRMGFVKPVGMADFYANGGRYQPRCHSYQSGADVAGDCDSLSSYLYFAESIQRPAAFYGYFCIAPYLTAYCERDGGAFWGDYMDITTRGVYYFNTRATSPYGEGKNDDTSLVPVYFTLS